MGGRFQPLVEMSPEERRQVITLPSSVVKLTAVKHLVLNRSNRVRLPAEIGKDTTPQGPRRADLRVRAGRIMALSLDPPAGFGWWLDGISGRLI